MAKRWLRGPAINTPGTTNNAVDHTPSLMVLYHFLTKLLGFTHIDEQVTGGTTRTFQDGYEATNTDGTLSGAALTFTTVSTPFVIGDIGKFLCILDATNPENCGIYEITGYNATNQVLINFYVPGGTFPTAQGGLTWWMFDTNNASYTPVTYGDYFVVRSPHSTYPFEVYAESELLGTVFGGAKLEVSPNSGAWDAVGHAWQAAGTPSVSRVLAYPGGGNNQWMFFDRYHSDAPHSRWYICGDTDGSFVLMINDKNATGVVTATMIALVDPLEATPARSANERLIIGGYVPGLAAQNTEVDRGDDLGGIGFAQTWEDYGNQYRWLRLMALIQVFFN